ncbi:MAG: polyprenyl synthetase family protein [Oscillospiraceae bacterium]|jgi:geranylgeranyl diphosphate synthase type II|nr:polyprenyl synthetase family protein [Oscillospiraceae bacterium]
MRHEERLARYAQMTDEGLRRCLPAEPLAQQTLCDAMRHSLFAGGKRLRPALLMEFYRVCGGRGERALPFACGLEMLHTYSLIHDDLPVMDDALTRRGKPCCHKVFGEATALLAGDTLLTAAFEAMSCPENAKGLEAANVLEAIHIVAASAGIHGMAGGQQLDMQSEALAQTRENAEQIGILKTGALLRGAAEAGCVLAGAPKTRRKHAASYAHNIGLAFQIRDDILNAEGQSVQTGKDSGSDGSKLTLVKLLGVGRCEEYCRALTGKAAEHLGVFDDKDFLVYLAETLAYRDK